VTFYQLRRSLLLSFVQRCGIAGQVIHTESKSDGLKRHRHDIGDLRGALSRGTRRRKKKRASALAAACVASSLAAARNRCIYVGDSCQRYLACAFLRLKDPKDGVNDILAVRANDRPWRTDAPQRTTLRAHLNWITLAKWTSIHSALAQFCCGKKAQEIQKLYKFETRSFRGNVI